MLALPTVAGAPSLALGAVAWEKPIAPGLVYRMEIDPATPRQLFALRLTPSSPSLRWEAQLAGGGTIEESGTTNGRESPGEMAKREDAIAAINGDFFSYDHGAPIGLTVRRGELMHTPARARAVFAWGPRDTAVAIGDAKATLRVGNSEPVPFDAMNQPVGENGFGLYTPTMGILRPKPGATLVRLKTPGAVWAPSTTVNARVEEVLSETKALTVRPGEAVLVANGVKRNRVERLSVGTSVQLTLDTPGFDWEKLDNLIGGGPMLVLDSKVAIDADEEGFPAGFSQNRHPRSAIGRTADGDVWLVTVDGRQSQSDGATLAELAGTMRRLGCTDAINLDGGGSSALHIRSLTVNRPSDGRERPVANGVLVFGPKLPSPTGKLSLSLNGRISKEGSVQAVVQRDGQPVPPIDVLFTARGAAWCNPSGRVQFTKEGPATVLASVYGQTLQAELEWRK
jgi:exopolysaccharide biosynthesis protein